MAALASIADTPHGRKMLMDMIHDNGDGTFTVTFADGSTETVDADLYVFNTGDLAYSHGGPLWPHILERPTRNTSAIGLRRSTAMTHPGRCEIWSGSRPNESTLAIRHQSSRSFTTRSTQRSTTTR